MEQLSNPFNYRAFQELSEYLDESEKPETVLENQAIQDPERAKIEALISSREMLLNMFDDLVEMISLQPETGEESEQLAFLISQAAVQWKELKEVTKRFHDSSLAGEFARIAKPQDKPELPPEE